MRLKQSFDRLNWRQQNLEFNLFPEVYVLHSNLLHVQTMCAIYIFFKAGFSLYQYLLLHWMHCVILVCVNEAV